MFGFLRNGKNRKKRFFVFKGKEGFEKYDLIQNICLFYVQEINELINKEKNPNTHRELYHKRQLALELKVETQDFILEKYKPYIDIKEEK